MTTSLLDLTCGGGIGPTLAFGREARKRAAMRSRARAHAALEKRAIGRHMRNRSGARDRPACPPHSAAIDTTLHLIGKIYGIDASNEVARIMAYDRAFKANLDAPGLVASVVALR